MTEEEVLAEVAAMKKTGNRGESEDVEGTPEGSVFWEFTHQPVVTTVRWPGAASIKITRLVAGQAQGPLGPGAPIGARLIYSE